MKKWIVSLFFSFVTVAHADTLIMKNGDNISGTIVSFRDHICIFSTNYNSTIKAKSSDIKYINTNKIYTVTFVNGDKITGNIKKGDKNTPVLIKEGLVYSFNFDQVKDVDVYIKEQKKQIIRKEKYNPPINYLSNYTVLLNPGEVDLDFGFKYRTYKSTSPLPLQGPYQVSSYSVKKTYFYLSPRFGITPDMSIWFNIPWTYTRIDDISSNSWTRHTSQGHIGDISLGLQYRILKESENHPSATFSFSLNAPSGRKKYVSDINVWKEPLNNSDGFWSITPSLSFVRITDPVTFFGGISYEKTFKTKRGNENIKYGDTASIFIGTGYSLNNISSFGSRFNYSWTDNLKYYGTKIKGTNFESEILSLYYSYLLSEKWTITPELSYPLNANGSTIGVGVTRSF